MFIHNTTIRVRYSETDQMGFAHHSNYAKYCENARLEALREAGINYKDVEEKGFIIPVISMAFEFKRPAYYDDILTIKTIIKNLPVIKIEFDYEFYNEKQSLINRANTVLVFVNKDTMKPVACPDFFIQAIKKKFGK